MNEVAGFIGVWFMTNAVPEGVSKGKLSPFMGPSLHLPPSPWKEWLAQQAEPQLLSGTELTGGHLATPKRAMLPLLVGYFRPLAERWSPIALRRRPRTEFLALSAKTKGSMNLKLDSTVQRTFSGHRLFRNERRPTKFDKKILLWTKRFKKEEDIPPLLSVEVLKAAHNQLRIRICYIMIALTLLGCVAMIISGKQAAKRDDTLLKMNIEKKAKWRMESQKEQELVAGNKE